MNKRMAALSFAGIAVVMLMGQVSDADWKDCKSDDGARAVRACTSIIKNTTSSKNRAYARSLRAWAYNNMERFDDALADYNQAIAIDGHASDYHGRAIVYAAGKKQYQLAMKDIDKAISLPGDRRRSYYVRGGILTDMGQYEKALANYLELAKLDPKSDETGVYARLGDTYLKLGKRSDAIANFKKSIEYDRDVEHCKEELKKLGAQ